MKSKTLAPISDTEDVKSVLSATIQDGTTPAVSEFDEESLSVDLTQADVDHGVQYDTESCPIAQNLNEKTGKHWDVGSKYALMKENKPCHRPGCRETHYETVARYKLPRVARKFVKMFDRRGDVDPVSFSMKKVK